MEPLDFEAVLSDVMSATLEAITSALQNVMETMAQVTEAMTGGFEASQESVQALAMDIGDLQVQMGGLALEMDGAAAATDADTEATDANTAAKTENAGASDLMGAGAKKAAMPLAVAEAAILATGAAAVHMAGDFQSGITSLVTGAGEAQSNMGLIHDGLLNISTATGESTKQLVDGMFMIESAGHHGKEALGILRDAAEGAKVGTADLGTVADATTTIMADFANQGVGSSQAVNTLIATVANGKTHMQDLSASLAQILPTASAAGISLYDVMGAMAAMTGEGVPAANAATYLRQTIIALEAPSKQTKDALASFGISTDDLAARMKNSLPGALDYITQQVGKKFPEGSAQYVEALKQIAGGSKQMQGILDLTGQHMKAFSDDTNAIGGAAVASGKTIQGWSLVQKDFNQQMSQGTATLQAAMIKLGEALMPVATALLKSLVPALKSFGDWVSQHGQQAAIIFGILAVVIGGALVGALASMAVAVIAATWPFILVGIAIAAVVAGVILLVTHWKQISAWLAGEWHAVITGVGHWFSELGTKAHDLMVGMWDAIVGVFQDGVTFINNVVQGFVNFIVNGFSWLYNHNYYFKDLVDFIVGEFNWLRSGVTAIWNAVSGFLVGVWNGIVSFARSAWHTISTDATSAWNGFVGLITSIGGKVGGAVQDNVVTPITSVIGSLITDAQTWGKKLLDMFISGIKSKLGDLGNAAHNVMSTVAGFLGFHSPAKEGPGAEADTWMPNLGRMLTDGLRAQAGPIGNAAQGIAAQMSNVLGRPGDMTANGLPAVALAGAGVGVASGAPMQVTVILKDETGMGGFFAGLRMLDPTIRRELVHELGAEMAAQMGMQGRMPIGYTGAR